MPPPVQPCTTASCAGNAARPSHPARVLIGEQEGAWGWGELGVGKARLPSLTFHFACHFPLGRKGLNCHRVLL